MTQTRAIALFATIVHANPRRNLAKQNDAANVKKRRSVSVKAGVNVGLKVEQLLNGPLSSSDLTGRGNMGDMNRMTQQDAEQHNKRELDSAEEVGADAADEVQGSAAYRYGASSKYDVYPKQPASKPGVPPVQCNNCVGSSTNDEVCIGRAQVINCFSCVGGNVCAESDYLDVGVGSCISDDACKNSTKMRIGKKSCIGFGSCSSSGNSVVSSRSCHGYLSCSESPGSMINTFSCVGSTYFFGYFLPSACSYSPYMEVGPFACQGDGTCIVSENLKALASSCIGSGACSFANGTKVESGSCVGYLACISSYSSFISADSCHGRGACDFSPFSSIDSLSCWGYNACKDMLLGIEVGEKSCEGIRTCFDGMKLVVGSHSCRGDNTCSYGGYDVVIEDNACNCNDCCVNLPDDCRIPSGTCNDVDGSCIGPGVHCVMTAVSSSAVAEERAEKIAAAKLKQAELRNKSVFSTKKKGTVRQRMV